MTFCVDEPTKLSSKGRLHLFSSPTSLYWLLFWVIWVKSREAQRWRGRTGQQIVIDRGGSGEKEQTDGRTYKCKMRRGFSPLTSSYSHCQFIDNISQLCCTFSTFPCHWLFCPRWIQAVVNLTANSCSFCLLPFQPNQPTGIAGRESTAAHWTPFPQPLSWPPCPLLKKRTLGFLPFSAGV